VTLYGSLHEFLMNSPLRRANLDLSEWGTTPAPLTSNESGSHRHQRNLGVQPRTIASCLSCEVAGYDAGSLTVCQRFDAGRD
jgi:hypothetical protein